MIFVTEATIPVSDPKATMSMFVSHLEEEHDIQAEVAEDGSKSFEQDGFSIKFKPLSQGLNVRIAGPNESVFIFFKEEIAEHVRELDPTAAANIRWSSENSREGALPPNFKVLTVKNSFELFNGMQRVTLVHEDVGCFASDDVHLKLMMPVDPARTAVWPTMAANGAPVWPGGVDKLHARFITLRHVRTQDGEVDIDIARHNNGLISNWACRAMPGQKVGVMGPAGAAVLRHSDNVFLAADGTGMAAVARLLESAHPNANGDVVVAAPGDYDISEYFPQTRFNLHSIAPEQFEKRILEMAQQLTASGKTSYAFFAGEFQNAQDMRKLFKSRLGLDKSSQMSVAYWRRGVPGHGS
ncbi:MAG: siderophore-interacting protein [Pseudomonadota bacterium]